ncbi:MAG: peptidoglycan editing factor PgeF [Rhodospirillales bacterium]
MTSATQPQTIAAANLFGCVGVRHGFFTRHGGTSAGRYASLNCGLGSGDDRIHVIENRARAARHFDLAPESLVSVYQIHSPNVIVVERPWTAEDAPRADAMVTDQTGIMLGILAADCAPVLFADAEKRVIGACHAGWRGALGGVAEATVAAMERLGAERSRIVAAVGPCIAQASYEVSDDFAAPFLKQDKDNASFFVPGKHPGKLQFDLPGYLLQRLSLLGVAGAEATGQDTQAGEADFFSYRRTTLRGEQDYGRLLSAIALTG